MYYIPEKGEFSGIDLTKYVQDLYDEKTSRRRWEKSKETQINGETVFMDQTTRYC